MFRQRGVIAIVALKIVQMTARASVGPAANRSWDFRHSTEETKIVISLEVKLSHGPALSEWHM
jgi:hypothetical protein